MCLITDNHLAILSYIDGLIVLISHRTEICVVEIAEERSGTVRAQSCRRIVGHFGKQIVAVPLSGNKVGPYHNVFVTDGRLLGGINDIKG